MLEKECIQSRGFKNIIQNNEAIGFQIKVRSLYYRGLWLSQIRNTSLKVDGIAYEEDNITWVINGKEYPQKELPKLGDIHWGILERVVLLVKKPQGLESGFHEIEFDLKFCSSYFPPAFDTMLSGDVHKRKLILV